MVVEVDMESKAFIYYTVISGIIMNALLSFCLPENQIGRSLFYVSSESLFRHKQSLPDFVFPYLS